METGAGKGDRCGEWGQGMGTGGMETGAGMGISAGNGDRGIGTGEWGQVRRRGNGDRCG